MMQQSQSPDTPMKVFIGIDVCKDALEVAFRAADTGALLAQRSYANTATGHEALIQAACRYPEAHFVMEATGNYHLRLADALVKAGLPQTILNPLVIKRYAEMKLRRLKTDKSDAALIAAYACEQQPETQRLPSPVQQQLKQIATLAAQLVKQRTALKNIAHANRLLPEGARLCTAVVGQQIRAIDRALARLEAEQDRLTAQEFAHVRRLAESVKGIGAKTAIALIAYLGDLSGFETHKQVSAYMGLNPVPDQSGQHEAPMQISKQGNARLRTLFYLCAQSAARHNRTCRALYERLLAAGKRKKVALIAVANKLVKQVFVVIKTQQLFDNHYGEKPSLAA